MLSIFTDILTNSQYNNLWSSLGAIGQWIGALATFIAAFIALRTARDTKKMYMIDQRPYVTFDGIEGSPIKMASQVLLPQKSQQNEGIQIGIVLRNVGKTIAKFNVEKFHVMVNGKTVGAPTFVTPGGIVYPGMVNIYRFPVIECAIKEHMCGEIEYLIEYSKDWKDTVYVTEKKIRFDIFSSTNPPLIRYIFLNENESIKPRTFLRKISDIFGI